MSRRCLRLAGGLVLALLVAGPLAACGKQGAPTAPKGEPNIYPRAYPRDPTIPAPAPAAAQSDKAPDQAPTKSPD